MGRGIRRRAPGRPLGSSVRYATQAKTRPPGFYRHGVASRSRLSRKLRALPHQRAARGLRHAGHGPSASRSAVRPTRTRSRTARRRRPRGFESTSTRSRAVRRATSADGPGGPLGGWWTKRKAPERERRSPREKRNTPGAARVLDDEARKAGAPRRQRRHRPGSPSGRTMPGGDLSAARHETPAQAGRSLLADTVP